MPHFLGSYQPLTDAERRAAVAVIDVDPLASREDVLIKVITDLVSIGVLPHIPSRDKVVDAIAALDAKHARLAAEQAAKKAAAAAAAPAPEAGGAAPEAGGAAPEQIPRSVQHRLVLHSADIKEDGAGSTCPASHRRCMEPFKVKCEHHVTTYYTVTRKGKKALVDPDVVRAVMADFAPLVGKTVHIRPMRLVANEHCVALQMELPDGVACVNAIPHITLAVTGEIGGKPVTPVYSNDLLKLPDEEVTTVDLSTLPPLEAVATTVYLK